MIKVDQYIKRLMAFLVCIVAFFLLIDFLPVFISIPLLSIAFSLLHFRITQEKPPYLFDYSLTGNYVKKGGLRGLLIIPVNLFGFIYDVIVWTLWGIYLVFIFFIDLLYLLKIIFFWLAHALIWILRQYVPFIVFIYKITIYYLIRWPWWIYQLAYNNIRFAFNTNSYRIALPGTLFAGFIIFLFYFLEIMIEDIPGLIFIGFLLSLLPLTWSYGEIASLRARQMENDPYKKVKASFRNGIEAVRSILFYITLFVVFTLVQLGLNLLGWIPGSGVPLGSFVFNLNTFISLLLLFLCILIVMGVIVIPSYRIYVPFSESKLTHTWQLLGKIFKKLLQYIAVTVPSSVFSLVVTVIPLLIITGVTAFTLFLKTNVVEIKIENLKSKQTETPDPIAADAYQKQVEHLTDLQQFPRNIFQNMKHRANLAAELLYAKEDVKTENEEYIESEENYEKRIGALENEIKLRQANNPADYTIAGLKSEKELLEKQYGNYKKTKKTDIARLNSQISYLELKIKQIPVLFFIGGLWLVIFGGMVLSFAVSYLGNVYHRIYVFKDDGNKSYWTSAASQIRSANPKQPLLGGTLFLVTGLLIYFLIISTNLFSGIFVIFKDLISF